ncbi:hypothetical protein BDW22DRAFT_1296726, partial [Trametopsis cervina]
LPGVLSWLGSSRPQLWIDQEGFRLVQPVFKLSAYRSAGGENRGSELVNTLVHGSAEFRPVERYAFVFHQAALEPPPTLRRLTMEGDESRDHLSRQATLIIKSNGVYSVSGSETFDNGPPSPHSPTFVPSSARRNEPLKLNWRFEYMVEDRYVEATGKIKPGEKSVIPLLFSCSPGLLHPTHGKKIKIMHVFKKGLTPKLASTKVTEDQVAA